jgi:hypothetical protein
MGRPINKRSFGQSVGQSIEVIANLGEGPHTFYIVSQSGSNKYRISELGSETVSGTISIVPKLSEDLNIGEGRILAYQNEFFYPVIKLSQHRVSVLDGDTIKSFSWKEENSGVVLLSEVVDDEESED